MAAKGERISEDWRIPDSLWERMEPLLPKRKRRRRYPGRKPLEWRYLWGPAVDQILAEENVDNGSDETVQWTLTDHLNTVRDIAKYSSGSDMTTVVHHHIYDAFGKVTAETNPAVDSLFLFTARPFDPDTGLQNNLNRWYDPSVGRWLSGQRRRRFLTGRGSGSGCRSV